MIIVCHLFDQRDSAIIQADISLAPLRRLVEFNPAIDITILKSIGYLVGQFVAGSSHLVDTGLELATDSLFLLFKGKALLCLCRQLQRHVVNFDGGKFVFKRSFDGLRLNAEGFVLFCHTCSGKKWEN